MAKSKPILKKVTATEEVKVVAKPTGTKVDRQNPPFDPDIPEQKQRWLR